MQEWYFEDLPLNQPWTTPEYIVPEDEMIAFAKKWDPLPMHIDPQAAKRSPQRGLIASAIYTMAVSNALGHRLDSRLAAVGSVEWKIRFPAPVRPGDRLVLTSECVEKRVSRSKPDRGIVRFLNTMNNQRGERVMEFEGTVLVSRRGPTE